MFLQKYQKDQEKKQNTKACRQTCCAAMVPGGRKDSESWIRP